MLLFDTSGLVARGASLLMMIPAAVSGAAGNIRRANVDPLGATVVGSAACTITALDTVPTRAVDPFAGNVILAVVLTAIGVQLAIRAIRRLRA